MNDIDRLVKALDLAPHPPAQGPAARELRTAIMETPQARGRSSWFRRGGVRLPVLISAVAAAAVAIAVGVGLPSRGPATEYANAAVSIARGDEYFSVTITDPAADHRRFEEAFRAVGLKVRVKVVPVAPEHVGMLLGPIVPGGFKGPGSVGVHEMTPCASAFCGKVWLPANLSQLVVFGVGRPARAGETYAEADLYDPSGEEALKGYTTRGKTVAAVRDELRRRELKVAYRLLWVTEDNGFFDEVVSAGRVKDDWIVNGTRFRSSDTVDVYIDPGPGAGPMPDSREVARPEWYDGLTD
ncbi:hypothetical protein [Nonomuraea sp. SYSU D8015]|uniref:hypothetical protein n=1 Tax=Nonomuraea sp. SYSU D8015 TaxID=2593644 RepID=UPI0016610F2B|nr:hypothetical protein [Nonomuraea sp. SYSU D8015]